MLSEKITSLADVSFHIVAYMYARFRYSGKNPMRLAVFWRVSLRFCGFRTPLTSPSLQNGILSYQEVDDYLSLLYRQGKELKEFGM